MVSVRRAVIFLAQILALLSIVVSTMAGALAGHDWLSNALPSLGGTLASLAGSAGFSILGAVIGFFVSTILVAIFFLAVELANNTRNPFNT
jgi:hypothetical protein